MRLDPDSQIVQQGFARAQTLDEVEALITRGQTLQTQGDLQAAQQQFAQAAAMDGAHQRAAALVAENRQMITDADYTAVMSQGFDLLQQAQPDAAIAAFQRALRIKPGSGEAAEAMVQTREQVTLASIAGLRAQAEAFEAAEDWQQAVAAYDSVLALDSNLIFALEGKDYSARRLQLDRLLAVNIEQPERLSDQAAYDEAQEVYRIGRDLEADLLAEQGTVGERLSQQLDTMEELLAQMQIPVEITLTSDNATNVTLYQVGQLGTFSETTLMLKPGRYVAVGTRPGYRDVREEFVVGFGRDLNALTIRCNEEVAAVNRP
jgi:tetratricopeptide (TPR) repeat protein